MIFELVRYGLDAAGYRINADLCALAANR